MNADRNPNFKFIHGNILDQALVERLLKEYKISTLVHFAAESHVDRSIHNPEEFITTNIVGTYSLLQAAKKVWLDGACMEHRFHHISTDEVYGFLGPEDPPFSETTAYTPNSPYAASKAASDHLVRAYHKTYGLRVTTSNCSNNYGPYQFPEKLIPLIIANILDGKPLPIYGNGLQIRDWLYVDDHNYGVDLILHKGKIGESYNIGGNNEWKNIDIVKLICGLIDKKISEDNELSAHVPNSPASQGKKSETLVTHVKDRIGHDIRYAINANKIAFELNYSPKESMKTGLQKTLDWYLNNEKWWRQIMDGKYRKWIEKNYQ